jgi:hypothetical protein
MSQGIASHELHEQQQQLLQGPLKHVAAAALAAALVPLAAVEASAQTPRSCQSGGTICGLVWQDTNNNGLRDVGEPVIVGAVVTLGASVTATDNNGYYQFSSGPGTYQVLVQIPPSTVPSPHDVGSDDTIDSDGAPDGLGNSVATVILSDTEPASPATDFGFYTPPATQPGTGTPGYWKNHPEAWPVQSITVGNQTFTMDEAIALLAMSTKDRTITMFSSLVPAKLNVLIGNDGSCVATTIDAADDWLKHYPVGSNVAGSSYAWKIGEPLHRQLDNYNNGMLCAPER